MPEPQETYTRLGHILLEPYTNYRNKHRIKCSVCSHEWEVTGHSVNQSARRNGTNGCPGCKKIRVYGELQAANKASIPEHIIPDPTWDGNRNFTRGKVWFHNTKCGHRFETYPNYVISGKTECTECGKELRTGKRAVMNFRRKIAANHTEWSAYKAEVRSYTERSFEDHKDTINPKGYTRSLLGEEGGYQLDHILPQRAGFDLKIPEELLGHHDNLRMIPGEENRLKSANLEFIPSIFDAYRDIILEYYGVLKDDTE